MAQKYVVAFGGEFTSILKLSDGDHISLTLRGPDEVDKYTVRMEGLVFGTRMVSDWTEHTLADMVAKTLEELCYKEVRNGQNKNA